MRSSAVRDKCVCGAGRDARFGFIRRRNIEIDARRENIVVFGCGIGVLVTGLVTAPSLYVDANNGSTKYGCEKRNTAKAVCVCVCDIPYSHS